MLQTQRNIRFNLTLHIMPAIIAKISCRSWCYFRVKAVAVTCSSCLSCSVTRQFTVVISACLHSREWILLINECCS